jgi:hypothetical protein
VIGPTRAATLRCIGPDRPEESWPRDAATTPDRQRIRVIARVVWESAGEERLDGYATRWSGTSVFVTPARVRCRNGVLGVWLDVGDVSRVEPNPALQGGLTRASPPPA